MIDRLFKTLRGTDWEMLTGFISPAFFDVVPTLGMAKVLAILVKDYTRTDEFQKILVSNKKLMPKDQKKMDHLPQVQIVLEIYFAQLFKRECAVLDLRSSAFDFKKSTYSWNPKPLYYSWDEKFLQAIRDMYAGFYANRDDLLLSGLRSLDLEHAQHIFIQHFGANDQKSVTFKLDHFTKSFQAIFESCKKHKTKLHPDFFALGAYLLCLYEHLERYDMPFDVRGAFDAAVRN